MYGFKTILCGLCLFIAFMAARFALAERYFLKGKVFFAVCNPTRQHYCLEAANNMSKAVKYNELEYFYKYSLAEVFMRIYDFTKDKRLLGVARAYCTQSLQHSWDRHYPYICLAQIDLKYGDRRKALSNLLRAKNYIPHNATLLHYVDVLGDGQ